MTKITDGRINNVITTYSNGTTTHVQEDIGLPTELIHSQAVEIEELKAEIVRLQEELRVLSKDSILLEVVRNIVRSI